MKIRQLSLFLENRPGQLRFPVQGAGRRRHRHPHDVARRHRAVRHPAPRREGLAAGEAGARGGRHGGERHRGAGGRRAGSPGQASPRCSRRSSRRASGSSTCTRGRHASAARHATLLFRLEDPDRAAKLLAGCGREARRPGRALRPRERLRSRPCRRPCSRAGSSIPSETLPVAERRALQARRLAETVRRALGVPVLPRRARARGRVADAIRSVDDVRRLPFTTKDDLRQNYPLGLLAVPRAELARVHGSSGTTGQAHLRRLHARRPRHLVRPRRALPRRGRAPARAPRPRRVRLRALHRRVRPPLRDRAGRRRGRPRRRREHAAPGDAHPRPRRRGARLHALVRAAHRRGRARGGVPPGRPAAPDRPLRRRALDRGDARRDRARARDPRLQQLRALRGRRPGRVGRVPLPDRACTCRRITSSSSASTRTRSRTCRTARWASSCSRRSRSRRCRCSATAPATSPRSNRSPCPCGRTGVRMSRVVGRSDDMLIIRGVNVFPSQIEEALLRVEGTAPHYLIEDLAPWLARRGGREGRDATGGLPR